GLVYNKRYTAAPRLMAELTGAARRLVAGKPAEEVAFVGGVRVLLDYLRRTLGKPQVNEVTDLLGKYFKGTRRRSGESMNEYITRKSEAFLRVSQALKRVQPHYKGIGGNAGYYQRGNDGPDGGTTTSWTTWGQGAPSTRSWTSGWSHSDWGSQRSWDWYGGGWWSSGHSNYGAVPSTWSSLEAVEDETLLPAFIQGWYLLADAALDSAERNIIATALGGDYSPAKVAQELRNQFPETELRRKDHGRRSHAFVSTEDYYETYEAEDIEARAEDLTDEGAALLVEAEDEAQQAMAVLGQARRTLKEARMRQHNVKMNRQYYRGNNSSGPRPAGGGPRSSSATTSSSSGGAPNDANMICLGCGVKGHRVANRPNKKSEAMQATEASGGETQHAPFVCFAEDCESALTVFPTTSQAVEEGYAIIDGGATKTLGSVHAVEALLRKNQEYHGNPRLAEIDKNNQPLFGFGNSTEGRCLSTCKVGVQAGGQAGKVQIHTLNEGVGPILLSIDALRSLGAIVDFREDLLVLTAINDRKIIPLRRSSTALGEESPENWNRMEIKQRIQEITEEMPALATAVAHKTPLETKMAQLSKSSRKKSTLREYLENELHLEVSDMDTIAAMQRKASNKILQECPVHGADAMGFGKYSQLSYQETYLKDTDYCKWAQATVAEGPSSIRLERFVRRLAKAEEDGGPKHPMNSSPMVAPRPKSRGYKAPTSGSASSSAASKAPPMADPRDELIMKMTTALQDLKEEVDQLRAERPRKVTSNADK
ncbi:unnamed protein product, partial [Symbiodinium sp. CCMP2456]